MIESIIEFSIRRRWLVIVSAALLGAAGIAAFLATPIDAIPDLSENQVIVFVDWLGHSPDEIEDQATRLLATAFRGIDGLRVVRSSSEFNFAMIHLIFSDRVSTSTARREAADRLARAAPLLPQDVRAYLGPDSPATGQIFWYALEGAGYDLAELRDLEDTYVKGALGAVPGVAEVASVGGMVAQYQIVIDPRQVQLARVTLGQIVSAVREANRSIGGGVIHKSGAEYVVRGISPLHPDRSSSGAAGRAQIRQTLEAVLVDGPDGRAYSLSELATVQVAPELRRGVFEKDGAESVGGVVAILSGENPLQVTRTLQEKIAEISPGLPSGVRIVPVYDRTRLIEGAVRTVSTTLLEAIVAASVCVALVLMHARTAAVIAVTLPLATLAAFGGVWVLRTTSIADIQTNVMSLAGIAVSIGVLVDVSIVVAENVMHTLHARFGSAPVTGDTRAWVLPACRTVGRPVFCSVLIMLLSFLPVFALAGPEGKMFRPLAATKSLALGAAALLAITLVPALCSLLVKGRLRSERESWLVRTVMDVYRPVLTYCLARPAALTWVLSATLVLATVTLGNRAIFLAALFAGVLAAGLTARTATGRLVGIGLLVVAALTAGQFVQPLGVDSLVPLDEGMVMDMPITVPRIAVATAVDDLKQRDMVLCRFPEVEMVVGKAGRADSPLDPAPLDMIETMIEFRPIKAWPRRKIPASDARRWIGEVADSLSASGLAEFAGVQSPSALFDEAAAATLLRFDQQQREFAYQANAEFSRELGPRILQALAQTALRWMHEAGALRTPPDDIALARLLNRLPKELANRFRQRPTLADVDAAARQLAATLAELQMVDQEGEPLRRAPGSIQAAADWARELSGGRRQTFAEQLFVAVQKQYDDAWLAYAPLLDERLGVRGAETFVRVACEELLARASSVPPALIDELATIRQWRQQPPPIAGRSSHHAAATIKAPPANSARSQLHAVQRQLVDRIAPGLLLWRVDRKDLIGFGGELDQALQMPGWTNVWTSPIQNRVDMLSTGVNTAVGVRVLGRNQSQLVEVSEQVAAALREIDGAANVTADQIRGKGYLEIRPDYQRVAQAGVRLAELNDLIEAAIGGIPVMAIVEGQQRRSVRLCIDRSWNVDEATLGTLPVPTPDGRAVTLGEIADVRILDGPASIKSENGLLRNYVRASVRGRGASEFVEEARRVVEARIALPDGVTLEWTGQFEYERHARRMLTAIVPAVLLLIVAILYWTYRDLGDALLMLFSVPGALAGGLLFQWILGYPFSVTVWVGYIACFGMAASTSIVMLVYLRQAIEQAGGLARLDEPRLREAVLAGAVHRLRPKILTEGTTIIGLAPMLWATGTGAEIIRPMAAPVLGGILIADEVIDLMLPVLFYHIRRRRLRRLHSPLPGSARQESALTPKPSPEPIVILHNEGFMKIATNVLRYVRGATGVALLAVLGLAVAGCQPKASVKDFEPKSEDARTILEKSLTAWKEGQAAGKIAGAEKPAIQVEDFEWKAGKKLKSFQIESEVPTTEGPKQFSVKLEIVGSAAAKAKYYVVGRDPMWVYRDKDWDRQGGG